MSIKNNSDDDISKNETKQSWFQRRRQSMFSRTNSHASKKKQDSTSLSGSEVLSTYSAESSKAIKLNGKKKNKSKGDYESGDDGSSVNTASLVECPICVTTQPIDKFPLLSACNHRCCLSCLRQYLAVEISESRVNLSCPACHEKLTPADMQMILENDSQLLVKWEEFMLRKILSVDPDCRWCPAPDCGYAVIAYGCASCPRLTCQRPGCNTEFCYHCRQVWHHNQTCDSAHLQRTKQLRVQSNSAVYTRAEEIKPCPKCGALIVKIHDGSCNHMTCSVCEAEFCWLCLQEITDLHYLSPSGCTFWGKKPWSRKKKILWQLGLLVGAPLGIGLVAGIALPVITFGLPVWVARKVRSRRDLSKMSKRSRNLAVVGSVVLTTPISPVVAAIAVGVGVPVMLLYVYCVVPFSLCRNGTYAMRSQKSGGMNGVTGLHLPSAFRLDRGGANDQRPSTSQEETFTSRLVPTNPSIGEASVGGLTMGSLNMSRSSNLDKAGRPELDGASMRALAGTSITGSMSGISAGPTSSNRMEMLFKETDQSSVNTQLSLNSTTGVTSVQIHMSDNVSEHSITSFPLSSSGGNTKRTYSSMPPGSRRKSQFNKRSSSVKSSSSTWNSPKIANEEKTRDVSIATKAESSSPLTIVNECQVMLKPDDEVQCGDPCSSHSSVNSGSQLITSNLMDEVELSTVV